MPLGPHFHESTAFVARRRSLGFWLRVFAATLALCLPAPRARAMPNWARSILDSVGSAAPDPAASAWILHRSMEVSLSGDGTTHSYVRYLVKVLQQPGARLAAVTERVYPEREVKSLNGWMRRADGSEDRVELRQAMLVEDQTAAGYYDDQRVLVASFPHTAAGCVAAFEYEVVETGWFNPYVGIYFQQQEPVRFVAFSLRVAKGWCLDYQLSDASDVTFTQDDNCYAWSARSLSYRKPEPLMPDWSEVSPRLDIVCRRMESPGDSAAEGWKSIGRDVNKLMLDAARNDSSINRIAMRVTEQAGSPALKVETIGRYVRDQVRYVAVEIGKGRIRPRPATLTFRNLYGDCKDKATLMRAMLAAVGLPSVPVLARVGGDVRPQLPSGSQFNHCIVAVPLAALGLEDTACTQARTANWFFFDPTAEHVQYGHLPEPLEGQHVLVCSAAEPELARLPKSEEPSTRRRFLVRAELAENGDLHAAIDVTDTHRGLTREALARQKGDPATFEERWRTRMHEWLPAGVLSGLSSTTWDDSEHVHFELEAAGYARRFGSEFVLHLIPVLEPQPPELGASTRSFPIQFGERRLEEFDVHWSWPAGFKPVALPANIADSCVAGSVRGRVESDSTGLRVRVCRTYSAQLLGKDEYATAQAFDHDASAAASMQLVLATKAGDR